MSATFESPKALVKLLREYPHPLLVSNLETKMIIDANEAGYEFLGRAPSSLAGIPAVDILAEADRPAVEASMDLLASGAIEGYQAVRAVRKGDDQEIPSKIWVRATDSGGHRLGLVTVIPEDVAVPWSPGEGQITMAGIVTDHDWTVEMVSSDVEAILGLTPEDFKGASLLGLLQPWDAQKLFAAVGRVTSDGGGATLRMHLRNVDRRWLDVFFLVVALCRHSPPRLGLAITRPEVGGELSSASHMELGTRGGDAVNGTDQLRLQSPTERFSTRQSEILARILRGERVHDIAGALYLSPSTVRNHLTAIYRKFGVHSQPELMAKLLR